MADSIRYNEDILEQIRREIKGMNTHLDSVRSALNAIHIDRRSGANVRYNCSIRLQTTGLKASGSTIADSIRGCSSAAGSLGGYCGGLSANVGTVARMFQATEDSLKKSVGGSGTALSNNSSGGSGSSSSAQTLISKASSLISSPSWLDTLAKDFDLGKLGKKIIGSFGPVGSLASFLMTIMGGESDGLKIAKDISKQLSNFAKYYEKWPNFKLTNRFGGNWGTKNYIKNLLGLNRYKFASKSTSWSWRFKSEFSANFKKTFVKSNGSPNWAGIIGVVIDTAATGIENYKRVKAGEISGDRAVVQTVTKVGLDLAIGAAATAIVAASLPVSAPVVLVAGLSAGLVWAVDGVTKLVTGGDKGLADLAAEGAGMLWDAGKKVASQAWDAGKKVVSTVADAGKEALSNAGKFFGNMINKVTGNSGAKRGSSKASWIGAW